MKDFSFIDLFAGIGGIRIAFESIGGTCVFSSDNNIYAQQTYEANFKEKPYGDITKISPSDIPSFDVLCAGFPCQPFSQVGLRQGFLDKTKGTLFFDIVKIAKHHKPKIIFLENVKNLLTHDKGNTFKIISEELTDLGYFIYYKILNAKNFGLAQNRERIYIVASKDKIDFEFPVGSKSKTNVFDILQSNVDKKYTLSDEIWKSAQDHKNRQAADGNCFGYKLYDNNSQYTGALLTREGSSRFLIKQEHNNPRRFTPREYARLQGFPDEFVIPVTDYQAYKQFGNSVAVDVIKEIAKEIEKIL